MTVFGLVIISSLIFSLSQVHSQERYPPPRPLPKSRWNDARAIEFQARELAKSGDRAGALALRRKLVEEYRDVVSFAADAQISIGIHFQRVGDYDQAVKEYEKVITLFPKNRNFHLEALTVMAQLYEDKLHDLQKALQVYERILREYRKEDEFEGDELDELIDGAEMKIMWLQQKLKEQSQNKRSD